MTATTAPKSGYFSFLVVCVIILAPVAFYLEHKMLAFLIIAMATFLMLASGVAVLVTYTNRQIDRGR